MKILSGADTLAFAVPLLSELRRQKPLVQNIANFVSMDIAANALLAIGASPAMVHAPEETPEFLRLAGALVINIGTLSKPWVDGMLVAANAANVASRPWVLDPVGAGATQFRNQTVAALLTHRPSIVRGNASEIMAVARIAGVTDAVAVPRGVDAANTTAEAEGLAVALAHKLGCTVAATGAVDVVTDGSRLVRLGNGHPLMGQVTALGCALSGIAGAFAAVTTSAFEAAATAVAIYGVAGEVAAEGEERVGPGSYRVRFVDHLSWIEGSDVARRLKVVS
jgi:hydroxyethylthiazole kinase